MSDGEFPNSGAHNPAGVVDATEKRLPIESVPIPGPSDRIGAMFLGLVEPPEKKLARSLTIDLLTGTVSCDGGADSSGRDAVPESLGVIAMTDAVVDGLRSDRRRLATESSHLTGVAVPVSTRALSFGLVPAAVS